MRWIVILVLLAACTAEVIEPVENVTVNETVEENVTEPPVVEPEVNETVLVSEVSLSLYVRGDMRVTDAFVSLAGEEMYSGLTGASGTWTANVMPGTYLLTVLAEGHAPLSEVFKVLDEGVEQVDLVKDGWDWLPECDECVVRAAYKISEDVPDTAGVMVFKLWEYDPLIADKAADLFAEAIVVVDHHQGRETSQWVDMGDMLEVDEDMQYYVTAGVYQTYPFGEDKVLFGSCVSEVCFFEAPARVEFRTES